MQRSGNFEAIGILIVVPNVKKLKEPETLVKHNGIWNFVFSWGKEKWVSLRLEHWVTFDREPLVLPNGSYGAILQSLDSLFNLPETIDSQLEKVCPFWSLLYAPPMGPHLYCVWVYVINIDITGWLSKSCLDKSAGGRWYWCLFGQVAYVCDLNGLIMTPLPNVTSHWGWSKSPSFSREGNFRWVSDGIKVSKFTLSATCLG